MEFKPWFWVTVVVIVVVAAALIVAWLYPIKAVGTPVYAPQGQVVQGFPQELLIDSSGQVTHSYSIAYSSSTNQYTVGWQSAASPEALFSGYETYFTSKNWFILDEASSSPDVQSIYAVGSIGAVNFTAVASGTGSAASLSYVDNQ